MLRDLLENDYVKFNGITKYPSNIEGNEGTVRLLMSGREYVIGTNEDIISLNGDKIVDDKDDILSVMLPVAEKMMKENNFFKPELTGVYGSIYTEPNGDREFRVFNVLVISHADVKEMLKSDIESIEAWRETGNQPYLTKSRLPKYIYILDLQAATHSLQFK